MIIWSVLAISMAVLENDSSNLVFLLMDILFLLFIVMCFDVTERNKNTYEDYNTLYNNLNESIVIIEDYNRALNNNISNIMVEQGRKVADDYNSAYKMYIDRVDYYTINDGEEIFSEYQLIFYSYEKNQFVFEDGSEIKTYNK